MKKLLIAILAAGVVGAAGLMAADGAAEAAAAPKKGACAADAAKLCKDVKPGEGRVKACLAEHKKELSEACAQRVERRAAKQEKFAGRGRKGAKACAADARELCKDVKPGEGRIKACLRQNLDKLSEGCKARQEKLDKAGGKEKKEEGKKA